MSAGPTPGPYRLSAAVLDGFRPVMAKDGAIVALVSTLSPNHIETGHVLAAAPELLALLIRYRNETPLGNQPHMIAAEADAVIAKAEGRS